MFDVNCMTMSSLNLGVYVIKMHKSYMFELQIVIRRKQKIQTL